MDTAEKPTDLIFLKGSTNSLRTVKDLQIPKKTERCYLVCITFRGEGAGRSERFALVMLTA